MLRRLYKDNSATLDDLREAVATLETRNGLARRLGGAHPLLGDCGRFATIAALRYKPVGEHIITKTYEARVARIVDAVVSSLRRCAGLR